MTADSVLNKVVKMLGLNSVDLTSSTDADGTIGRLLNALNIVYLQVLTEYAPNEVTKNVTFTSGDCLFSAFSDKVFQVLKLVDENGCEIPFKVTPSKVYAEVPDGSYKLTYYSLPQAYVTINGTLEVDTRITEELLAKGVAAEYSLENQMFEEAVLFEKKFKEGLAGVFTAHGEKRYAVKRWI